MMNTHLTVVGLDELAAILRAKVGREALPPKLLRHGFQVTDAGKAMEGTA